MYPRIILALLGMLGFAATRAPAADPFAVAARLRPSGVHAALLVVEARIPPGHRLYAEDFKIAVPPPTDLSAVAVPAPAMMLDPLPAHSSRSIRRTLPPFTPWPTCRRRRHCRCA